MMGRRKGDQASLFYEFRLDDRVPKDHLLRRIDVFVTAALADVHEQAEPYYSAIGRPSVDPELMIRMTSVGSPRSGEPLSIVPRHRRRARRSSFRRRPPRTACLRPRVTLARKAIDSYMPLVVLKNRPAVYAAAPSGCTLRPSPRSIGGLRITWSPGLTPSLTSTSRPKSRAIDILWRWATPFSTTATCKPS
jgi:hypothetical protein